MMIWIDSREKDHAIQKILNHFQSVHTKYFVSKLPVGDYMSLDNPRLVIDRKQNLSELCQNVCRITSDSVLNWNGQTNTESS